MSVTQLTSSQPLAVKNVGNAAHFFSPACSEKMSVTQHTAPTTTRNIKMSIMQKAHLPQLTLEVQHAEGYGCGM
jgi:hypothetical protein